MDPIRIVGGNQRSIGPDIGVRPDNIAVGINACLG